MSIRVNIAEVCDARGDDSSNAAGNKKINFLKEIVKPKLWNFDFLILNFLRHGI
jgi:hypothetical protein